MTSLNLLVIQGIVKANGEHTMKNSMQYTQHNPTRNAGCEIVLNSCNGAIQRRLPTIDNTGGNSE